MEKRLMTVLCVTAAAVAMPCAALGEDAVVGTAASPVAVDVRTDRVVGAVGTAAVRYSPLWTTNGASVSLEAVSGGVTNVLLSGTDDAEGTYILSQPTGGDPMCRLQLRTFLDGRTVGEVLSATVSFGVRSGAGTASVADTRTDALQQAADAGAVRLSYDTAWATNAAAVTLKAVRLSGQGGAAVATNGIFSAVAAASGSAVMRGVGKGWWRLLCHVTDASGDVLLEYSTAEFCRKGGMIISFK